MERKEAGFAHVKHKLPIRKLSEISSRQLVLWKKLQGRDLGCRYTMGSINEITWETSIVREVMPKE